MVMDVINRDTQLIVGDSRWTGKRVSDFGVVAQNSRTRRVDQGLSKEVRCRILDLRRRRKSGVAFRRGLPSGAPIQVSIKFHWSVEMMEANDMLLWTPLRHRLRVLAKIEEFRPKIEEFHLATAEPDGAQ